MLLELHNIIYDKNIALYGLGTETERLIQEWNEKYKIVGLLDSFKTEGEQFGYPIISIQDVVKMDNAIIVVVARPGSCKAIAKKIGDLCKENRIEVYDIRGNNLLEEKKVVYDFSSVSGYKRADILDKINAGDIVSFDLFDTLIVRNVLSHADVIEIIDVKLKENGVEIKDFCEKRIAIEKRLSQKRAPRLCEIYEKLLEESEYVSISARELARLEFETDLSLMNVRVEVVDLIGVAKKAGKKVCITTDTYYNNQELKEIFEKTKIEYFDELFASCEYGVGKTCGLFDIVKDTFKADNIIHIGDDIVADIESAKKYGISAFHIFSSAELFDAVGELGVMSQCESLSDRIKVGMFVAEVFNSPFVFESDKNNIQIETARKIGYLFCAPMILDFCYWFEKTIREKTLHHVWFGARDGYLLKKIFEVLYPELKTSYILTSRTAAIRAGVESDDDIKYIDGMKFSGSEEENLWKRFGISVETIDNDCVQNQRKGMLKYTYSILENAKLMKKNYLKYLESIDKHSGDIAFFDFVAKGTTQMFLEKITKENIIGLYFLQLEREFMKDKSLSIYSFYDEREKTSAIFDNYYIIETILTSPYPSVDEFTEEGQAVYATETRSKEEISCIMNVQKGILEYIDKFMKICPESVNAINKNLDEKFLELIHNVEIVENEFRGLKIEDPFFNRYTNIIDVL